MCPHLFDVQSNETIGRKIRQTLHVNAKATPPFMVGDIDTKALLTKHRLGAGLRLNAFPVHTIMVSPSAVKKNPK
jgi:hypothetical protein